MKSGPNPCEGEGRVVDAEWMEENMPDLMPGWHPDDEEEAAGHKIITAKGLMYKGKWLISPERQEKTMRLFWVSLNYPMRTTMAARALILTEVSDYCLRMHTSP